MSRAGLVRERFGTEHPAREERPPGASLRDLQRVRKRGRANRAGRPRHLRQLRAWGEHDDERAGGLLDDAGGAAEVHFRGDQGELLLPSSLGCEEYWIQLNFNRSVIHCLQVE